MRSMELGEVYEEVQEEKVCMLQNTFDDVWRKIRDHVGAKSLDKAFVGLIKKLAEQEDADRMLELLIDMESKMKKMKAEKLAEKPKDTTEGMDFISIVVQGYGTDSEESEEDGGVSKLTGEEEY